MSRNELITQVLLSLLAAVVGSGVSVYLFWGHWLALACGVAVNLAIGVLWIVTDVRAHRRRLRIEAEFFGYGKKV
jgi:uncharacterized membrane protein YdfJ with MMPL/SSD domain